MNNTQTFSPKNNIFPGKILVLAGPPAVGKDTLTVKLEKLYPKFLLFDKMKAGVGRKDSYRMISAEEFAHASASGELLTEVRQHGNRYGVDKEHLFALINAGFVPIIHTAQESEWKTLSAQDGFVGVILWADPKIAHQRLLYRDGKQSATMADRLQQWEHWTALKTNDFTDSFPGAKAIIRTDVYDVNLTGELLFHKLVDDQ